MVIINVNLFAELQTHSIRVTSWHGEQHAYPTNPQSKLCWLECLSSLSGSLVGVAHVDD